MRFFYIIHPQYIVTCQHSIFLDYNFHYSYFFPCVGACFSIIQKHLHYQLETYTFYCIELVTKLGWQNTLKIILLTTLS